MLVSYKWLKDFVDLSAISPTDLADKMSRSGIEVENVHIPSTGLKNIVVGYVQKCEPHPDSDHLSICQVDIGEEELSQIVCGAPNVREGKNVIVALPSARIANNVKIKKSKMRGEVSNGMICSLQELGYSDAVVMKKHADGIQFLPDDAIPGSSVFPYLDMDDAIVELSITPNRADALSMHGVAHEVAAIYKQQPTFTAKELVEDEQDCVENYLDVKVLDSEKTPTYLMRVIKNVKIGDSPQWLQNRLMNAGIRPINNAVDVTNYVLLLFGQPLHAFDYHKIGSKEIVVRQAKKGEMLVTLDEEERTLSTEDIVITNGEYPIGFGGVMGGLNSEISDETTTIALEAALFDSQSIRKTSQRYHLRSESSSRFEKGINQATVQEACDFAAAMIAELCDATVTKGTLAPTCLTVQDTVVTITLNKINDSLGTNLSVEEVLDIFSALDFGVVEENNSFTVTIPPRRWDIKIEADLVEEVARIYGYDHLPSTLPKSAVAPGLLTQEQHLTRKLKELLVGSGCIENISYALTTTSKALDFALNPTDTVQLNWPMSSDRAVLRQNLIGGLLDNLAYNIARKNKNLAVFEVGKIFMKTDDLLPTEKQHLAIALTGLLTTNDWQTNNQKMDFFLLKGILEHLFELLGLSEEVRYEKLTDWSVFHPGRSAKIFISDIFVGVIGQVHPTTAQKYEITETYVCELDLEALFALERKSTVYQAVSKFPTVQRDMALLVDKTVTNQQLMEVMTSKGGRFLSTIELFDIFEGAKLGENKKSMAYRFTFQNPEATLTDEEVTKAFTKIEKALVEEYQAEIR